MPRYYLVQYVHRADGCWVSPPECEEVWKQGCFKQVRFDNASGISLVKCLGGEVLDPKVATEIDPNTGIRDWLATIARAPKSGPTPGKPDDPVVAMTLDEDEKFVKAVALGWVE